MPNLFTKTNLFKTPESVEDLQDHVKNLFNQSEVRTATIIMAMTWNLAAELYKEKHPEEVIEDELKKQSKKEV